MELLLWSQSLTQSMAPLPVSRQQWNVLLAAAIYESQVSSHMNYVEIIYSYYRNARMVVKDKLRLIPWKELSKYANDKIVSKTEVGDMSILLFI